MAEMNNPAPSSSKQGHSKQKPRSSKRSTRVDLTAMVDLGFLLITFFMLTASLNKPQSMELNMPEKDSDQVTTVSGDNAISIVLAQNNEVYYYIGVDNPQVEKTNMAGIREVILKRQQDVQQRTGDADKMTVLIKAQSKAKYQNLVEMLDEMAITNVKRYALVDYSTTDSLLITQNTTAK